MKFGMYLEEKEIRTVFSIYPLYLLVLKIHILKFIFGCAGSCCMGFL